MSEISILIIDKRPGKTEDLCYSFAEYDIVLDTLDGSPFYTVKDTITLDSGIQVKHQARPSRGAKNLGIAYPGEAATFAEIAQKQKLAPSSDQWAIRRPHLIDAALAKILGIQDDPSRPVLGTDFAYIRTDEDPDQHYVRAGSTSPALTLPTTLGTYRLKYPMYETFASLLALTEDGDYIQDSQVRMVEDLIAIGSISLNPSQRLVTATKNASIVTRVDGSKVLMNKEEMKAHLNKIFAGGVDANPVRVLDLSQMANSPFMTYAEEARKTANYGTALAWLRLIPTSLYNALKKKLPQGAFSDNERSAAEYLVQVYGEARPVGGFSIFLILLAMSPREALSRLISTSFLLLDHIDTFQEGVTLRHMISHVGRRPDVLSSPSIPTVEDAAWRALACVAALACIPGITGRGIGLPIFTYTSGGVLQVTKSQTTRPEERRFHHSELAEIIKQQNHTGHEFPGAEGAKITLTYLLTTYFDIPVKTDDHYKNIRAFTAPVRMHMGSYGAHEMHEVHSFVVPYRTPVKTAVVIQLTNVAPSTAWGTALVKKRFPQTFSKLGGYVCIGVDNHKTMGKEAYEPATVIIDASDKLRIRKFRVEEDVFEGTLILVGTPYSSREGPSFFSKLRHKLVV